MVNIEQVRLLEQRVQKVISRMAELRAENTDLRERLGVYQDRIEELEERVNSFSSNQAEIEQGILNALHQLDEVEDAVAGDGGEGHTVVVEEDQQEPDEEPAEESLAEPVPSPAADDASEPVPADSEDAPGAEDDPAAVTEDDEDSDDQTSDSGPELDIF
jgi:uncharacterized protein YlxW (UPF0749 family)